MTVSSCLRLALVLVVSMTLASCITGGRRGRYTQAGIEELPMRAEPAAMFLAGLDTDVDGIVTRQELDEALDRLWASADANKDGSVSILELNNWRQHWFGTSDGWPGQFHFDTDGNSLIPRTEFDNGIKAIFDDFDRNRDGKLERSELLAAAPRHGQSQGDRETDRRQGDRGDLRGGGDGP